jgi:hypothetical protein
MNRINQSQNKQNNNKYKYMTIQSRINKEYTTPASAGLAPSEWAVNLSNKNPKKEIKLKTRWILSNYLAYMQMQGIIYVIVQECP